MTKPKKRADQLQAKDRRLKRKYGITLDEMIKIYKYQKGLCAICKKPLRAVIPSSKSENGLRIEIDHDHRKKSKEAVRGLLCGGRWAGCNRKLGRIDRPDWLRAVIAYLENPPAQAVLNSEANGDKNEI
ncbi:MAG TPA: endonuclease VII domain-containing protein [Candidatus Paceibacterota bacterium]|jgi:hypothetical protein|nr:endonuclease VII domain-containing protein [Candidatus Paceibacterota bacterium]